MKKISAIAIAVIMVFSSVSVYAEDGKTAEILKTVKERIEIPSEFDKFESSMSEGADGTEYMFEWSSDAGYVCVECNDKKVITYYNCYVADGNSGERKPAFPKTDIEDLKNIALTAAEKINPGFEFTVEERNSNLYGGNISFDLKQTKNGIEIVGSEGYIGLNAGDLSVRGMRMPYIETDGFEDGAAQDKEAAEKAFSEKLGLELVYKRYYSDGAYKFFPAYINDNGNKYISAITGDVFEYEPSGNDYLANEKAEGSTSDSGGSGGFTREEQNELEKIGSLLSKEQIEKTVRANKIISIPKTYELKGFALNRRYDDEEAYTYGMSFSDGKKYISVCADAKTGDIYNLNAVEDWDAIEDADRKTCENAVKVLTPSLSGQYSFNGEGLSRYENGVRVFGDAVNVCTDKDGNTVYYNITYSRGGEFADLTNALTEEEAAERMFELGGYKLKYFINNDKKAYLAYDFEKSVNIHALTGKSVGYNGEELSDEKYMYNDLENHYAKEYIEKLAKYGIGFAGDEFKPDEYITSEEFDGLLSFTYMDLNDASNETLTREAAAVMFVKALGLDGAAKYDSIFVQPFNDVTQNKGYIAILKAMGIFSGDDNGNFNPQSYLTRAEAAVMVYKYLSR